MARPWSPKVSKFNHAIVERPMTPPTEERKQRVRSLAKLWPFLAFGVHAELQRSIH